MYLLLTSALTAALSVLICIAARITPLRRLKYGVRQIIIGILFGVSTCIATEFGLQLPGAVVNARDAAPLCAGLIFGAPSGIIAGIIGSVHRLFWGAPLRETFTAAWLEFMFSSAANGGFTRVACTVGTVCSGFFGAIMRKYLFDNRRPSWFYGCAIAVTTEVFHLFLVFVCRLNYISRVFSVISVCSVPMICANAATVLVSLIAVSLISGDKRERTGRTLSRAFQLWLLVCVLVSFAITTVCMFYMQWRLGVKETEATLSQNLEDIHRRISIDGVDGVIDAGYTWHVGTDGGVIIAEIETGADGGISGLTVLSDGSGYSRGDRIAMDGVTAGHVFKTSDNFFSDDLFGTPVYGMYMPTEDGSHMLITYVPKSEALLYQGVSLYLTMFFEVLVYAALFVQIYYLIKKLVVENLARVNSTLDEITNGNLDAEVDVRSHTEFASLSDDINETVGVLKQYIADAAARIDRELEVAKSIQRSALPGIFPPYPNRTDFDIYAMMDPAKEVGGDFYDFYFVDENTLAFLIADVSGKGIPAAMFMMTAKTVMRSYMESGLPVNDVLARTNEKLCQGNEAGMFVTSFIAAADLKSGMVSYANAGHNPPLLCRRGSTFEYISSKPGFVLGGMEGINYGIGQFKMEPGDKLYLYTDGVTEAMNESDRLYGTERLRDALNAADTDDVHKLCDLVMADMDAFVGNADQFDDITMVSFIYKGDAAK